MVKRLLSARRLVAVFGFAVALLGWVAAFVTVRGTSDLEDRLASAEAELSETRSALVQTSDDLAASRSRSATAARAGRNTPPSTR